MKADAIILRHKNETCAKLAEWLRQNGCEVYREDDDLGLIEATIPVALEHTIKKLPCVSYVRLYNHYQPGIVVHPTEDAL
jgi:hypothetical protein